MSALVTRLAPVIITLSVCLLALLGGCREGQIANQTDPACTPACHGCGLEDGCGTVCGCPTDQLCNAQHVCEPEATCTETCADHGWSCGQVCGRSCGSCGSDQVCDSGTCFGAVDISCEDCTLKLIVADRSTTDSGATRVVLAVEYYPREGQPLPRITDLRLRTHNQASLVGVERGAARR